MIERTIFSLVVAVVVWTIFVNNPTLAVVIAIAWLVWKWGKKNSDQKIKELELGNKQLAAQIALVNAVNRIFTKMSEITASMAKTQEASEGEQEMQVIIPKEQGIYAEGFAQHLP